MSTPNPDSTPTNRPEACHLAAADEIMRMEDDPDCPDVPYAEIIARHCPQPDGEARRLLERVQTVLSAYCERLAELEKPTSIGMGLLENVSAYLSRTADKEGGGT